MKIDRDIAEPEVLAAPPGKSAPARSSDCMSDADLARPKESEPDDARRYNRGLTPLHPPEKSLIRASIAIFWGFVVIGLAEAMTLRERLLFARKS